ncbi:MAG: amidophosphoribosyltransferase [Rickettsiaceae bacterium H1]|nr:amidophosphoribosyltransferase [Rickettsiaceae bacterium H1]
MGIKEKCGVFAINNMERAPAYCALGLHALQHRGQEGAGIAVKTQEGNISADYVSGQINDHFDKFNTLQSNFAIGHVRYSTSGNKFNDTLQQPIFTTTSFSNIIALAHNGNLINAEKLRQNLTKRGCIFRSDVDTEILIHLIAASKKNNLTDCIIDAILQIKGAYSLVIMTEDNIMAIRDSMGIRPLALGKLNKSYVISSESCGFDIINADFIRDIKPGEILIIDKNNNTKSIFPFSQNEQKSCIFEYIYFARPDSIIDGLSVYRVRKEIGKEMAKNDETKNHADLVVPVPDSGVPAAIGYAQEAKLPFEFGIIRNHYVGRTFIQPTFDLRNLNVKLKHNINCEVINEKKVILVDDSIVRGTTSRKIVQLVRDAGAKEIHMRISSPPITHPCFYGIDTPEKGELIANGNTVEEIRKLIGVDSLKFTMLEDLYKVIKNNKKYCDACFTGNYLL